MLNAIDYVNIAATIAALPATGGTVYLPAQHDAQGRLVPYTISSTILVDRPVNFVGDGASVTVIKPATANPQFHMFDVRSSFVQFDKLTIQGGATKPTPYDCVQVNGMGVGGRLVEHCNFRDVVIENAGRNALRMIDVILSDASNCFFIRSGSDGVYIDRSDKLEGGTTTLRFMNSMIAYNKGRGVYLPRAGNGMTFFGCSFEGNEGGGGVNDGCGLAAKEIYHLELYSCYFEVPPPGGAQQFLSLERCASAIVDGCSFYAKTANLTRAARFANSGFARFTNNVAEGCSTEVVSFDSECNGAVEFGNRDMRARKGQGPRIKIEGRGTTSLSSGTLNMGRFYRDNLPPAGTTPGFALPGSIAWIENPVPDSGQTKLQISDGAAWRSVPVGSRKRSVFVPAAIMRTRDGTSAAQDEGTFPNRYSYVAWPGDAATTNGVGVEWTLPLDYLPLSPDSLMTFKVVWTSNARSVKQRWACALNVLAAGEGENLAGAGRTFVQAISAGGTANGTYYSAVGTFRAARSPGQLVRLNVARRAQDTADDFAGTVRFVGLILEYAAP